MKKNRNRTSLLFILSLCVLFIAIALLVFMFMQRNRERIIEQNQHYLADAASQSVRMLDEVFDFSAQSIAVVSRLYELQLDEPQFDFQLLESMSGPKPFDYLRFVDKEGRSWESDGKTIECLDREYYLEGLQGNSGICYIEKSRFTQSPILIFYTPLYYEGEIIGVVNGVMSMDTLAQKLNSSYFGESATSCICLPDLTVICASTEDGGSAPANPDFFSNRVISDETRAQMLSAIQSGSDLSFRYAGKVGDGNAYLSPIAGGEFLLIQTLSSTIAHKLAAKANEDGLQLELMLIAILLGYVAAFALYANVRNRRLFQENNNLSEIVESIKRLYSRFFVIDLDANSYYYLEEGNIGSIGIPPQGKYTECLDFLREQNSRREAEGETSLFPVELMTKENIRNALSQQNWYTHADFKTPSQRWERLSLIKLDMESEQTSRVLGAVEDISDSKRLDEEKRRALETAFHAAEAASRAKSDFLSRMSHDIRTPMNAIIGLTAIMGLHLDDRERVVDCLSKITVSSRHLLELINEVLDMSKIEAGKLVLSEEPFSLPSLLDSVLDIVQPGVNDKQQNLNVHIRDIVHEDVVGDSQRLHQVCLNILSNAVKYTPEGGSIDMTVIELPCAQPLLGKYDFIFEDTGIGMSPEFLERIFDPFERAIDERVSGTQGTGLGMTITQSIVHLMGGVISVESEVGKGSRFTVHLSLKLQEVSEYTEDCLTGLSVLVADDEQVACETACLMLSELGMDGEWVLSGREAVERVQARHAAENDFHAVILDWKMPGMDGVQTARAIRDALGPEIPIIILSAYDWSVIESEAREAGVNAFIGKPLFKSRLRGVFLNLMSEKKPHAENPLDDIAQKHYEGKRALLVEDNELNQEIAQEILEMTGLTVDIAENGQVAVEKFSASAPHAYSIVFMDIQMPVMNGYEATRAIRALPREDAQTTPIVAMSANTFNEDVQKALESGMNQHTGKPLDFGQLMSVLERWVE